MFLSFIVLIHQVFQKGLGINHFLIDSYLDDLLAVPVLMGITLIIERGLPGYSETYFHSPLHIAFVCLLLSVCFEYILPELSDRYVSDPFDLLGYTVGAFLYYFYQPEKNLSYINFSVKQ